MKTTAPPSAGIPPEILCSADLTKRPPGFSAMEFLTAQYELGRGIDSALTRRLKTAQKSMTSTAPTATATASPPSGISKRFQSFIETGNHSNPYTQADARAMLDQARSLLLTRPAPTPAAPPRTAATATPQPRATATPAPSAPPPALITADQFQGPPPPKMLRSEFDKMTDSNRSKFIRDGGKLIADPKPAR